jgi:aminomethyltransferase
LKNTVGISARRFEESPFIERTQHPDMVRGVYAGRYFAISLNEDYIEKYWCLRQKALIFDTPEKPVEISGPDAESFLEYVLARKVSKMSEGTRVLCHCMHSEGWCVYGWCGVSV